MQVTLKKSWETVRNILNKNNQSKNYPPTFVDDGKELKDPKDIADEFNHFFL